MADWDHFSNVPFLLALLRLLNSKVGPLKSDAARKNLPSRFLHAQKCRPDATPGAATPCTSAAGNTLCAAPHTRAVVSFFVQQLLEQPLDLMSAVVAEHNNS
jgi:hypothetical protein